MPELPRRAPGNRSPFPDHQPGEEQVEERRDWRVITVLTSTLPDSCDGHLGLHPENLNSQEFAGPIFLPGILLEQVPFSMALYLFFKKCYPWLFITTVPFLYFLLRHPEAKEKNRTQQRVGPPYGSLQVLSHRNFRKVVLSGNL